MLRTGPLSVPSLCTHDDRVIVFRVVLLPGPELWRSRGRARLAWHECEDSAEVRHRRAGSESRAQIYLSSSTQILQRSCVNQVLASIAMYKAGTDQCNMRGGIGAV